MIAANKDKQAAAWQQFETLLRFTLVGYIGALTAGSLLDFFQYPLQPPGEWLVRALAGQGAGLVAARGAILTERRRGAFAMARTYGYRRLLVLLIPWGIDYGSRRWGIATHGVVGFYLPFCYALTAQIDLNLQGWRRLRPTRRDLQSTVTAYWRDPSLRTGLLILLLVPVALVAVRSSGFRPTTYTRIAMETLLANLCWLPPLVAWLSLSRTKKQ